MSTNKEVMKMQYESMVRQELSKVDFNINAHKRVIRFILATVVTGFFFAWCSSSDESFLPVFIRENEWGKKAICFFPMILAIIFEVSIVISAYNRRRKIDFEAEMSSSHWRKIFHKFILDKLGYQKDGNIIKNLDKVRQLCTNHEDIYFFEGEFVDYLMKHYAKYIVDVSFDFYKNLAKVILLENEIRGTLLNEENGRYTFIVKDNIDSLAMSSCFL